jgi:DUF4097 and DUF4098 domain-containing protein YvlB
MRIRCSVLILAGIAALLTGCDVDDWGSFGDSHAYEKNFHYSYALKPGGRLEIENYNGSIEIAGWDREQVEIDGVQYGATPELRDAIKIEVETSGDAVRIRTVRPAERRGGTGVKYVIKAPRKVDLDRVTSSNGSMKVDDIEGRMRLRTSNGSVRTARVRGSLEVTTSNGAVNVGDVDGPATIRTTNGRVTAEGIRGALEATSSNGSIHARLSRPEPHRGVRLATTNGSIELTMESMADNDIRASTSNGGITVKLPAAADAHIHAHTSHSSIRTEFDMRKHVRWSKNELEGEIDGGGPTVELTSTNGRIQLLKF